LKIILVIAQASLRELYHFIVIIIIIILFVKKHRYSRPNFKILIQFIAKFINCSLKNQSHQITFN